MKFIFPTKKVDKKLKSTKQQYFSCKFEDHELLMVPNNDNMRLEPLIFNITVYLMFDFDVNITLKH